MILPDEVLNVLEKESNDLNFGNVSVTIVKRGSHLHFEVDKHFTIIPNSDLTKNIIEEKGIKE